MAISEATIRELTRKAIEELGHLATPTMCAVLCRKRSSAWHRKCRICRAA